MGYPLPLEEDLIEMLSFMSLDAGQPEKARAVLELAAEYYPRSETAHASLVDICLGLEDIECAAEHAGIADRIAGGTEYEDRVAEARRDR
jgi:hypothetical protein